MRLIMKKKHLKFHKVCIPKARVKGLSQYFNQLTDPRDNRGKKFDLNYLMNLILTGSLMGAHSISNIENILELHQDEISQFIDLKNGIPSHDCLNDIIDNLNPDELETILTQFATDHLNLEPGTQIAYDGTAVRAATDRIHDGKTPYILNSLETGTGIILSALKVEKKENEKTAILRDLETKRINECIITADALNNSRAIMDLIIQKDGHFVFPVKREHHELLYLILNTLISKVSDYQTACKNTSLYGVALAPKDYEVFTKIEKNRSRLEERRLYVTDDLSGIDTSLYPHIRKIGILETTRTEFIYDKNNQIVDTKTSFQWCALITDLADYSAAQLLEIKRSQWIIEAFHNKKDNSLLEDRCTLKKGHGLINYAIIRRIVNNCLILLESIAPETKDLSVCDKLSWLLSHPEQIMMLLFGYISDWIEKLIYFHEEKIIQLNSALRENENKVPPPKLILKGKETSYAFNMK